jgi:hypothetical protein
MLVGVPPYDSFDVLVSMPDAFPEGAAVLLRIEEDEPLDRAMGRIVAPLRNLRRAHPKLLIGGYFGDHDVGTAEVALRLLGPAGLRVCLDEPPRRESLREAVARAGFVAQDVESWLGHRLRPRGALEVGVMKMLALVLTGEDLGAANMTEIRRWVWKLGLPRLSEWRVAGRLLSASVDLQSNPGLTCRLAARTAGFADGATFSHAYRRRFGCTAREARRKLGWEWLLVRFLHLRSRG